MRRILKALNSFFLQKSSQNFKQFIKLKFFDIRVENLINQTSGLASNFSSFQFFCIEKFFFSIGGGFLSFFLKNPSKLKKFLRLTQGR